MLGASWHKVDLALSGGRLLTRMAGVLVSESVEPRASSVYMIEALVQVWDSQSLQCLRTLEGHEDNVRVLAVGESYVFSGSWDKSIRFASLPATASNRPACKEPTVCLLLGSSSARIALT